MKTLDELLSLLPVSPRAIDPLEKRNEEREYIERLFKNDRIYSEEPEEN